MSGKQNGFFGHEVSDDQVGDGSEYSGETSSEEPSTPSMEEVKREIGEQLKTDQRELATVSSQLLKFRKGVQEGSEEGIRALKAKRKVFMENIEMVKRELHAMRDDEEPRRRQQSRGTKKIPTLNFKFEDDPVGYVNLIELHLAAADVPREHWYRALGTTTSGAAAD